MNKRLLALLLTGSLAAATLSAAPGDSPALGPALTAAGAKFGPMYFSRNAVLQIKADAPLPEPVWQEIEVLAPHEVGASGKGFDDAAVARLAKLPLEVLYLDGSSLTEAGWAVFRQMPQLKKLSLSHIFRGRGPAPPRWPDIRRCFRWASEDRRLAMPACPRSPRSDNCSASRSTTPPA